MRLYKAVCKWLEAHADQMNQPAQVQEPHSEGNNFTQAELGNIMPNQPELHNGWRPDVIELEGKVSQPISLRWRPKP